MNDVKEHDPIRSIVDIQREVTRLKKGMRV